MENNKISSVLFVCMGNICRSPTAEAMMRSKAKSKHIDLIIDSAGTHAYHLGETPDKRSMQAGIKRGLDFEGIRARQVCDDDFARFDLILAADHQNLSQLRKQCPLEFQHKLHLIMDYAKDSGFDEVPDPYYGGQNGFEVVLDLLDAACSNLLKECL